MSMGKLRKPAKKEASQKSVRLWQPGKMQAFEENLRFARDGLDSSPFVLLY
jgi:hypothetical protein